MRYILETQRLRLREFTLDDTKFIIQLFNSQDWIQYIGDRNVKTEEQAVTFLENGPLKSYLQHGYGLWLVEKKAGNIAIGMCGIINRDTLESPDIGFAFLPEFTGKGYAYEMDSATLFYAKNKLCLPKIFAITLADNHKSIQLLNKIGLKSINTYSFPNSSEELLLYST